jgi:hypothetical protein
MKDRELVLLMDGVIRFVDVGTQIGVWPRTIRIGQVSESGIVLMRLLDDYIMLPRCSEWWLCVAMSRGTPESKSC